MLRLRHVTLFGSCSYENLFLKTDSKCEWGLFVSGGGLISEIQ